MQPEARALTGSAVGPPFLENFCPKTRPQTFPYHCHLQKTKPEALTMLNPEHQFLLLLPTSTVILFPSLPSS